jgi:hypothetical protein
MQWSDRYEAYALTDPLSDRSGSVPGNDLQRQELLDSILAWLSSMDVPLFMTALNLYDGTTKLLYQHDGTPGSMRLTPSRFHELQTAWKASGLPDDLYYPASSTVEVEEAAEVEGHLIKIRRRYSPLSWRIRDRTSGPKRTPAESERSKQFASDCRAFLGALRARIAELSSHRQSGPSDVRELVTVHGDVLRLLRTTLAAAHEGGSSSHDPQRET